MKKFLRQTLLSSLFFAGVALISPLAVAAKDVRTINLYGIDTGIVISNDPVFSGAQIAAIVASVILGAVLIVNGKFIKRILSK